MISAQKIINLIENGIIDSNDYKVGSASLDVHLGDLINNYKMKEYTLGDHIDDDMFEQREFSTYTLKPNESVIISIKEKFNFPKHITGLLIPRGSIIKIGLSFPVNFINAGYKGNMSLLLTNTSQITIHIPSNTLIGQVIFFDLKEESENPYSKEDKYYDEQSDKSKLDLDEEVKKIYEKAFPSLLE